MDKILAIVVLVLFVWIAIPRLIHGQWIAPTAVAPNSWEASYVRQSGLADASAPSTGFGWFHFDFWNHPSLQGQPASTNDLRLRPPKYELQ
jgi:hypothetical protein